ncbi:hypothetical protein [Lacticaseibacillus kribbianus]|uniref:hypothetical protein n=1 Tax=Lacticaseibacillus kribbianus TaxID=2926292 RepID=UPI001CD7F637|nr:hypothetical protein [Lacticaseibacillus kribbianus]
MKKALRTALALLAFVAVGLGLTACKDKDAIGNTDYQVTIPVTVKGADNSLTYYLGANKHFVSVMNKVDPNTKTGTNGNRAYMSGTYTVKDDKVTLKATWVGTVEQPIEGAKLTQKQVKALIKDSYSGKYPYDFAGTRLITSGHKVVRLEETADGSEWQKMTVKATAKQKAMPKQSAKAMYKADLAKLKALKD